MSRAGKAHLMSMVITQAVRLAFPDSRAKRIARALGCSFMTGRRIAETGRASDRWELVSLLRRSLPETGRPSMRLIASWGRSPMRKLCLLLARALRRLWGRLLQRYLDWLTGQGTLSL